MSGIGVKVIECRNSETLDYNLHQNEELRKEYPKAEYIFKPNWHEYTLTVIYSPAVMELAFAEIDAKDDVVTGYNTVGVGNRLYTGRGPRCEHNLRVLYKAEAEYLKGLVTLQQHIRDEFEPQLVDDVEMPGMSTEVRDKVSEDLYEKAKVGHRHLYYT